MTLKSTGNGKPAGEVLDTFRVGAIVQATGWRPTEPRDHLPYGKLEDVIRNVDLEAMVKEQGRITRPSDGKEVKSIAFIQCGGSRDKEHHSYCSSICCLTSLKQALYLRERDDDAKAYIFYEFMRTPGQYEDFYRRVQEDPGVFLTKGEVADVTRDDDGGLVVTASNTMPGEQIKVKVDLVVLAAGMVPNSADGEAIRALEDAKVTATKGDSETQRNRSRREGGAAQASRGNRDPQSGLSSGARSAGARVRFPGFALHLLPLREPAYRDLPGRVRAPADGRPRQPGRRSGRGVEGDSVRGDDLPGRGGPSRAPGTSPIPTSSCRNVRSASAAPRSVPSACSTRTRKGTPLLQGDPLPPLRRLHGGLPRADRLLQGLLGEPSWRR